MEEEEDVFLVCMPEEARHCHGSLLKSCSKCGGRIWVTPASLAGAGSKAKLVCLKCAPKDEAEVQGVTDGQLRELSRDLGREVTREEVASILAKLKGELGLPDVS